MKNVALNYGAGTALLSDLVRILEAKVAHTLEHLNTKPDAKTILDLCRSIEIIADLTDVAPPTKRKFFWSRKR